MLKIWEVYLFNGHTGIAEHYFVNTEKEEDIVDMIASYRTVKYNAAMTNKIRVFAREASHLWIPLYGAFKDSKVFEVKS